MRHIIIVILFIVFSSTSVFSQRDAGDTLLMKRPQYFGVFVGRLQYMAAPHYLYEAQPIAELGISQVIQLKVEDAMHAGFFFTFPFLHRMEWDMGFGVFSFKRQKVIAEVTSISSGYSNSIISMHTWIDNRSLVVTEYKSHFSVVAIQHENYSLCFGAGGWLASQRMEAKLNPGSVGVEANITAYYHYNKSSFVQIHVSPGWMRNGYYINFTLGICYQNMKTMRAHPKHYYVRTYDQEE
ncbi:hypothetical protein BH09BAC5_BH09BAC5_26740 [soil metagenome]